MDKLKIGDICEATVTYKNLYGVFVDAGDYNICMAFRDNMPDDFYDSSSAGDRVKVEVINIDEYGRCSVAVLETLK